MKSLLLGLLAETFIHPGSGRNGGAVDLPVAREAATDYPFVPGSSLKGALKDRIPKGTQRDEWFGQQEGAGQLLFSDARLLALPVRSLTGAYRWLTCPHLIERLNRDRQRSADSSQIAVPSVLSGHYLGQGVPEEPLYLEERSFSREAELPEDLANAIRTLVAHLETGKRLDAQLAVVADDDFVWFARNALAIQARNVLRENKTSTNLWYEESLPPDTLLYTLIADRGTSDALQSLLGKRDELRWLQVGGNETVGQGWFAVKWPEDTSHG